MEPLPGYDWWKTASPREYEDWPGEAAMCRRCHGEGRLYLAHACATDWCEACEWWEECRECRGTGSVCDRCGAPCRQDVCWACCGDDGIEWEGDE